MAIKWLQRRIAFATSMRRHRGSRFKVINEVDDLQVEDDDPAAVPVRGSKPTEVEVASNTVPAPVQPLRKAAQ